MGKHTRDQRKGRCNSRASRQRQHHSGHENDARPLGINETAVATTLFEHSSPWAMSGHGGASSSSLSMSLSTSITSSDFQTRARIMVLASLGWSVEVVTLLCVHVLGPDSTCFYACTLPLRFRHVCARIEGRERERERERDYDEAPSGKRASSPEPEIET